MKGKNPKILLNYLNKLQTKTNNYKSRTQDNKKDKYKWVMIKNTLNKYKPTPWGVTYQTITHI